MTHGVPENPKTRKLSNSTPLHKLKAVFKDQLYTDDELTPATFKIGYGMANFMTMDNTAAEYKRTGDIVIFPSQETLAKDSGCNLDTIRVAIAALIRHGHLRRLARGNQFTGANQYQIIIKEKAVRAVQQHQHLGKIRDAYH